MPAPRIALSSDRASQTDSRAQSYPLCQISALYSDAIHQAQGLPIVLPLHREKPYDLPAFVDGLLLCGGDFDIPPQWYGQKPHPLLGNSHLLRSQHEKLWLEQALQRHIPVLGICGGMQLLNVFFGGTLYQDQSLREQQDKQTTLQHLQASPKSQGYHDVHITEHSLLAKIIDKPKLFTNSTHHQLIHHLAKPLQCCGKSDDGVIEAIYHPHQAFVLGIQWHPEAMQQQQQQMIYDAFVKAALR